MKLGIKQITLLDDSGCLVFHQAYQESKVNKVLFSGFAAAICMVAQEFGSHLKAIQFAKHTMYIRRVGSLILVINASAHQIVKDFVNILGSRLAESTHLRQVFQDMDLARISTDIAVQQLIGEVISEVVMLLNSFTPKIVLPVMVAPTAVA